MVDWSATNGLYGFKGNLLLFQSSRNVCVRPGVTVSVHYGNVYILINFIYYSR